MTMTKTRTKRALVSVSDKEGLVDLGRRLSALGYELVSSGGTRAALVEAGLEATAVSDLTGFAEMLGGRVKTLHPAIHGGILARDTDKDRADCSRAGIDFFDLVVVNLYPFSQTVARPDVSRPEAIENIDIGGPTLIRAAAKNHDRVYVLVDPDQYEDFLTFLEKEAKETKEAKEDKETKEDKKEREEKEDVKEEEAAQLRRMLARRAFLHTAAYDAAISDYLIRKDQPLAEGDFLGETFVWQADKLTDLRYGENPHQRAALYSSGSQGLAGAKVIQGKALSFNNWTDLEAAFSLVLEFEGPACAVIKHTNPCGVALGRTIAEAYERAHGADPVSAFGSVVAFNDRVDEETARLVGQTFVEAVVAPSYTEGALAAFKEKKNIRILELSIFSFESANSLQAKMISGGILLQDKDQGLFEGPIDWVGQVPPSKEVYEDLVFAMKVVKHVKSNAIVTVKDKVTTGIGPGQTNRVGAARIALEMAQDKAEGSVLASDAFFPFRDTVDLAADYGIVAIVQPGGSIRDDESIRACQEHGLIMGLSGRRHFKH